MENSRKKKIALIIAILVAIIIIVLFFIFRSRLTATTMRILRLEGTVSLEDNGREKTVRESLRLKSGNALATAAQSLVSIGLDDTKIVTLNENSRAEFVQKRKKLNLQLTEGSLFFDVSKPLADDESFEIATNSMVVGIRGTSGLVSVEDGNESLTVTDGHVHVTGTNHVTGEIKEIDVYAGEKIVVYLYNDREVDSIEFQLEKVTEYDLPEFVLQYLREHLDTLDRVVAATGWSRPYILGETEKVPEVPAVIPEGADTDSGSGSSGGGDDGGSGGDITGTKNAAGDTDAGADTDGTAGGDGATVDGNRAAGQTTGATPAELQTASGSIVLTNPDNGVLLLSDGTLFDPAFYAATNADVVDQYGTDTVSLVAHYIFHGKEEGRPPIAPVAVTAKAEDTTFHFDPNAGGSSSSSSSDDDDDDDDNNSSSSSSSSSSGGSSGGGGSSSSSSDDDDDDDNNNNSSSGSGGSSGGGGSSSTSNVVNEAGNVTLSDGTQATYDNGTLTINSYSGTVTIPASLTNANDETLAIHQVAIDDLSRINNWESLSAGSKVVSTTNSSYVIRNDSGTFSYYDGNGYLLGENMSLDDLKKRLG